MQDTIRQHFVPRTYLKHFSNLQNGKFVIGFIPTSNFDLSAYNSTNIEKICLEKHLYTLPGATTQERMWIENLYSDLFEKDYNKAFEILIDANKRKVTQSERHLIISTVISMYYRNTNWNKTFDHITESMITRLFNMAKAYGKEGFMIEKNEVSIKNKNLEEIIIQHKEKQKPIIILSQIRHIIKLISIRSHADQIMVNKLETDKGGFITSDNPVTCNNVSGQHIMPIDPTNMFALPLNKKHHLTILPNTPEWRETICRNTFANDIALFPRIGSNTGQIQNAQKFILGDYESLKAYFDDTELMKNPDKETKKIISVIDKFYQA